LTALALAALLLAAPALAAGDAELARRLYDLGARLAAEGKTDQAVERYQEAAEADPSGLLADDALLAAARLHYPVAGLEDLGSAGRGGVKKARPLLERVRDEYRGGDAAPEALFLLALTELDPDNPERDADEAWGNLATVVSVYPESAPAERALVVSAILAEQLGRPDAAHLAWFQLLEQFPGGPHRVRARLGLGRTLIALGQPETAIRALHTARERAGDDAGAAAEALDLLQLALRQANLNGRSPGGLYRAGTPIGEALDLRQPADLAVRGAGELLVADRGANALVTLRPEGTLGDRTTFARPEAVSVSSFGGVWLAGGGEVLTPWARRALSRADGKAVDRTGALAASGGDEAYVIDAGRGEVLRLDRRGELLDTLTLPGKAQPVDLAALPGGGVAVLDARSSRILLVDGAGQVRSSLGPTGEGWALSKPAALARDLAGNLYVLDTRERTVFVIGPDGTLTAKVVSEREGPGAFNKPGALAVDRAGRILIWDAKDKRVVVFE
jgi:tetratricopeptide (TPR) repeat protein